MLHSHGDHGKSHLARITRSSSAATRPAKLSSLVWSRERIWRTSRRETSRRECAKYSQALKASKRLGNVSSALLKVPQSVLHTPQVETFISELTRQFCAIYNGLSSVERGPQCPLQKLRKSEKRRHRLLVSMIYVEYIISISPLYG